MSTVDEGLEAQIRNIEQQYGKSLNVWIAIVKESGLTKHTDMVAMLKSQYGMSHGSAHRVALKAREADAVSIAKAAGASGRDPVAELYSGKKAGLKPLHDVLMTAITTFGDDIELAPKKGYMSLRRSRRRRRASTLDSSSRMYPRLSDSNLLPASMRCSPTACA